jgi:hypothetical protein
MNIDTRPGDIVLCFQSRPAYMKPEKHSYWVGENVWFIGKILKQPNEQGWCTTSAIEETDLVDNYQHYQKKTLMSVSKSLFIPIEDVDLSLLNYQYYQKKTIMSQATWTTQGIPMWERMQMRECTHVLALCQKFKDGVIYAW